MKRALKLTVLAGALVGVLLLAGGCDHRHRHHHRRRHQWNHHRDHRRDHRRGDRRSSRGRRDRRRTDASKAIGRWFAAVLDRNIRRLA